MTDEYFGTRMFIYGTEAELRPVSAAVHLRNLNLARKYEMEEGGDNNGYAIVFWAGMIADSAYDENGKPLFSSYEDVLEKLTLDEISGIGDTIYSDITLPPVIRPYKEDIPVHSSENVQRDGIQEIGPQLTRNNGLVVPNMVQDKEYNELNGEAETFTKARKTEDWDFAAATAVYGKQSKYTSKSDRRESEMRRISDFFERDSRRYDSSIT